jgi:hypothetical protein
MNETYLAWFVICVVSVFIMPFFCAAIIHYQPVKKGLTERMLEVWLKGFVVFAILSFAALVVFLLIWALSVVTK